MLSFKQFITERLVDPVKLAQRTAKIYGKKEKYGKWLRAEKGQHIPLKSYRAKEADSVFNKYDRVMRKKHKEYGREPIPDEHFTEKTFSIKDLRPTQPTVTTSDTEKLKSKIEGSPEGITVATHKGQNYILDGHHRVMGAAMRGEKEVPVKHINLDDN